MKTGKQDGQNDKIKTKKNEGCGPKELTYLKLPTLKNIYIVCYARFHSRIFDYISLMLFKSNC